MTPTSKAKPNMSKVVRAGKSTAAASKAAANLVNKRVELLFEIGCEEIPAGMLPRAIAELKTILEKHLTAENLRKA